MGITILTPALINTLAPQEQILARLLTSLGYRGPLQESSGGMSIHVIDTLLLLTTGRTLKLPAEEYGFEGHGESSTNRPLVSARRGTLAVSQDLFTTFWRLSESCTHPLASKGREDFLRGIVGGVDKQRPELFLGKGDQPIARYTPEELLDLLPRLRNLVGLDRGDPWSFIFETVYREIVRTGRLSEASLAPEIGALLSHPREQEYERLLRTVDGHYHDDLVRRVLAINEQSGSTPLRVQKFSPLTEQQRRWLAERYNGKFPLQAKTAVLYNVGGATDGFQNFLLGTPWEKNFPFTLCDFSDDEYREAMKNTLRSFCLDRRRGSVGMMIFLQLPQVYDILHSYPNLLEPGANYFSVVEGMVGVFREMLKFRRVPIRVLVPETHAMDVPILQWAKHPEIDVCLLPAGKTGEGDHSLAARWMEKALAGIEIVESPLQSSSD